MSWKKHKMTLIKEINIKDNQKCDNFNIHIKRL